MAVTTGPTNSATRAIVLPSGQASDTGSSSSRRWHSINRGANDELKARVAAERLQQGLPPRVTDLTVLSRLALRMRQAPSQARPDGGALERADGQDGQVPLTPTPPAGKRMPEAPVPASAPVGRSVKAPDGR